jgi:hypothetical protein
MFNTEKEQRIKAIQYPIEARESARNRLGDNARKRAWCDVAQADENELVHTKKKIATKAQQSLDGVLASSEVSTLTDNLEMFTDWYLKNYGVGYKDALRIRQAIDKGHIDAYKQCDIWLQYDQQRQMRSQNP